MSPLQARFWRESRQRRQLTQSQVAKQLGLTTSQFVSNVESGRARYSLKHMRILIKALKLNPETVVRIMMREEKERLEQALKRLWD